MRSLYRVIKSGQTVLGEGRVPAYQMTGPETAQAEEISGNRGTRPEKLRMERCPVMH